MPMKRLWQSAPTQTKAERLFTFFSDAYRKGCDLDTSMISAGCGLERMAYGGGIESTITGWLGRTKQQIEKGVKASKQYQNQRRLFLMHLPFMRVPLDGLILTPLRAELNLEANCPWQIVHDMLDDKNDVRMHDVKLMFDESLSVPDEAEKAPNKKANLPIEVHECYWLGSTPQDEHRFVRAFEYDNRGQGLKDAVYYAWGQRDANSRKGVIYKVYDPNYRKRSYTLHNVYPTKKYVTLYRPRAERMLRMNGFTSRVDPRFRSDNIRWDHAQHDTTFREHVNGTIFSRYTEDQIECDHCVRVLRAINTIDVRKRK